MSTLKHLTEYLVSLPVVSTHEHHHEDAAYREMSLDEVLYRSYVGWLQPTRQGITDREAFLDQVRYNAYFVWLERGLELIYGVPRINTESWDRLSSLIHEAHAGSSTWHLDMMRTVGRYRRAVQDTYWQPGSAVGHPEFFAPTFRINAFVMAHHPAMADHNGVCPWSLFPELPTTDFSDYLDALAGLLAAQQAGGRGGAEVGAGV